MEENEEEEELSTLSKLLKDKIFVDYFNVFLSLPVFHQKLVFKSQLNGFEFNPPVTHSKQILDKKALIKWLEAERLPYFKKTALHREYTLCKKLLASDSSSTEEQLTKKADVAESGDLTGPTATVSNSESDTEQEEDLRAAREKQKKYNEIANEALGSVIGMRKLRQFLKGCPAEKLINFWLEIEQYHDIPNQHLAEKWMFFRELQIKYFQGRRICTYDSVMYENSCDYASSLKKNKKEKPEIAKDHMIKMLFSVNFIPIQNQIINVLKSYWLKGFLLYALNVKKEVVVENKQNQSAIKVNSISDIPVVDAIMEIDMALRLLQADKKPTPAVSKTKAEYNWKAMFPENQVDDTFLKPGGECVTVLPSGKISVDPINSSLDLILDQFTKNSPTDGEQKEEYVFSEVDVNMITQLAGKDDDEKETAIEEGEKEVKSESIIAPVTTEQCEAMPETVNVESAASSNAPSFISSATTSNKHSFLSSSSISAASLRYDISCLKRPLISHLLPMELTSFVNKRNIFVDESLSSGSSVVLNKKPNVIRKLPVVPNKRRGVLNNIRVLPPISQLDVPIAENADIRPLLYSPLSEDCYRNTEFQLTLSIATDSLAGNPFEEFLQEEKSYDKLVYLQFWKEIQTYLLTKKCNPDLKDRRRMLLYMRYFVFKNLAAIPKQLLDKLKLCIKGQEREANQLRKAQDLACAQLADAYRLYLGSDKKSFIQTCTVSKKTWREKENADILGGENVASSTSVLQGKASLQKLYVVAKENDLIKGKRYTDAEKMILTATSLALDVAQQFECGLPMEELKHNDLQWFQESDYGSLIVKKVTVVRRKDLVEHRRRLRAIANAKRKRLEQEIMREEVKSPDIAIDDRPFYLKSFKKAGVKFNRPTKPPRTFQDILKDQIHREFFKRYLQFHNGDSPMAFCIAVEDLKKCQDIRSKQFQISSILHKYFGTVSSAVEMLQCDAQIIQTIPTQDKVTVAMLISAETWVARQLEEHWFEKYLETFPEDPQKDLGRKSQISKLKGRERVVPKSTMALWRRFVRIITHFRNDILDPNISYQFEMFLKDELKKEIERQKRTPQGYVPGTPIKKVISAIGKQVDITKLVSDLHFVAEAERFRHMWDEARCNAASGRYCESEEKLIETKAKMLVECFIDSDIPPRVQINVPIEVAAVTLHSFRSGMVDRSLFHPALIQLLPFIIFLWKKFQKHTFIRLYEKWLVEKCLRTATVDTNDSEGDTTPDYTKATLDTFKTKAVVPLRGEENIYKLNFNLTQGITIIKPTAIQQKQAFELSNTTSAYVTNVPGIMDPALKPERRAGARHTVVRVTDKNKTGTPEVKNPSISDIEIDLREEEESETEKTPPIEDKHPPQSAPKEDKHPSQSAPKEDKHTPHSTQKEDKSPSPTCIRQSKSGGVIVVKDHAESGAENQLHPHRRVTFTSRRQLSTAGTMHGRHFPDKEGAADEASSHAMLHSPSCLRKSQHTNRRISVKRSSKLQQELQRKSTIGPNDMPFSPKKQSSKQDVETREKRPIQNKKLRKKQKTLDDYLRIMEREKKAGIHVYEVDPATGKRWKRVSVVYESYKKLKPKRESNPQQKLRFQINDSDQELENNVKQKKKSKAQKNPKELQLWESITDFLLEPAK